MNKNINDYKRESFKIIIEIIPLKDIYGKYGKFINFNNKYQSNFHIYFNNDTKEIKRKSIAKDDKVNRIKIIIDYERRSLASLFYNCTCIEKINFIKFKRNDITLKD